MCICTEQVPSSSYNNNPSTMNNTCSTIASDGRRNGGPNGAHSIYRNFVAQPLVSNPNTIYTIGCYNSTTPFYQLDNSTSHSVYTCAYRTTYNVGQNKYFALGNGWVT